MHSHQEQPGNPCSACRAPIFCDSEHAYVGAPHLCGPHAPCQAPYTASGRTSAASHPLSPIRMSAVHDLTCSATPTTQRMAAPPRQVLAGRPLDVGRRHQKVLGQLLLAVVLHQPREAHLAARGRRRRRGGGALARGEARAQARRRTRALGCRLRSNLSNLSYSNALDSSRTRSARKLKMTTASPS